MNMKPNEAALPGLKDVFVEMEAETLQTLREWDAQRTLCLKLPRGRELAFEPSRATAEESAHLADCANCQRLLAKFRAVAHPGLSLLYASKWKQLPAEDLVLVQQHAAACGRCGLITTIRGLLPAEWAQPAFARLRAALEATVMQPAAVGLHRTAPVQARLAEVVETVDWTVAIEENDGDIRILVNRRDDGQPHHAAKVVIIGPGEPVTAEVPLSRAKQWWAGAAQVTNPWANELGPLDLSVLVAEVE